MKRSPDPHPGPSLSYERAARRAGQRYVAGVDEVGRGSWAGPVVAAAVMLPLSHKGLRTLLGQVRDSKQLSALQRQEAYEAIRCSGALASLGWSSHHLVDRRGLAYANRRAMCRAINGLQVRPDVVLIDHFPLPECDLPQVRITHGDAVSLSIAAASIVAKVFRDRCMDTFDRQYPGYGFDQHKGYGTALHRAALDTLGVSPLHRRSFKPVALVQP